MHWPAIVNESKVSPLLLLCLVCFTAGFLLNEGLHLREVVQPVARAEIRTSPGDVQPARTPGAAPTLPAPTVPRGTRRAHTVEVRLQPDPVELPARGLCPAETVQCAPVALRLDVVTDGEGQPIAAVRAQGATVGASTYIPDTSATLPRDKRITGILLPGSGWLVAATQDYGRFSVGVAGGQVDGAPFAGLVGSISIR